MQAIADKLSHDRGLTLLALRLLHAAIVGWKTRAKLPYDAPHAEKQVTDLYRCRSIAFKVASIVSTSEWFSGILFLNYSPGVHAH